MDYNQSAATQREEKMLFSLLLFLCPVVLEALRKIPAHCLPRHTGLESLT